MPEASVASPMKILPFLLLPLVMLVPATQACSIAYQEFSQGDLGGDTVVTNLGQDVVAIDLGTGQMKTLDEGFFPHVRIDDGGDWIYIAGQDGLGADCSGDKYLKILRGAQTQEAAGVQAFDIDSKAAFIRGNTVTVAALGSKTGSSFSIPAAPQDGFSTPPRFIALDDSHVAVSSGDRISVYSHSGIRQWTLDVGGPARLDWHDGRLIAAVADGQHSTFWIATKDAQTKLTLETERYAMPQIAAGKHLYLKHGDKVAWVQGESVRMLVVPDDVHIGAIAADDRRAVLLVVEGDNDFPGDAKGIQVVGSTFGKWYRPAAGVWLEGNGPAFAWTAGPALQGSQGAPDAGQDSPGVLPLLPLGLAGLLGRRR